jgi:lysocardiolipin and lysophospholipid acyltransferase
MRLWKFIFLKNWEVDRVPTGEALGQLGRRAVKHQRKLAVLIYPEGTLVSALTRPKSKAYAEKRGVVSRVRFEPERRAEIDVPSPLGRLW